MTSFSVSSDDDPAVGAMTGKRAELRWPSSLAMESSEVDSDDNVGERVSAWVFIYRQRRDCKACETIGIDSDYHSLCVLSHLPSPDPYDDCRPETDALRQAL